MFTYFLFTLEKSIFGYKYGGPPLIVIITNCFAYSQIYSDYFNHLPESQDSVVTKNSRSEAHQPGFESYFCLLAVSPGQIIYLLLCQFPHL